MTPKIVWNNDTTYGLFVFRIISWSTGTWPLEERVLYARIRSALTLTAMIFLSCVLLIEIAEGRTNSAENIDSLMVITSAINGCVKVSSFKVHAKNLFRNFSAAIEDYAAIDTSTKRDVIRKHAFIGRAMGCSMVFVAYACGACFLCTPYFVDSTGTGQNGSAIDEAYNKFPLPVSCISSFLAATPITYVVICLSEFMLLINISTANCGSDCFFLSIVLHVCGQIQLLKLDLADCNLERDRAEDTLRTLILRHSDLLILARLLVDTISTALLVQLFISCSTICIIGLQCILSLNAGTTFMLWKSILVMVTLLMQLLSYSYVSDYLKTQTEDIGFQIYSTTWYTLPPKLIKNLVFVIMRSQQPVQLTAAQFIPLNMETYMSILKTSFSYLSVLRVMLDT